MSCRLHPLRVTPTWALALVATFACQGQPEDGAWPVDTAEGLWGEPVHLNSAHTGPTLIQPISPANCGYCLFDGEFVQKNYLDPNEARGGRSFLQCLFNPQLDVYTYLKHFRHADDTVLTFPPELHRHHRNGFPWLTAVDGDRVVYAGGLHPYEGAFRDIEQRVWPGEEAALTLTSPLFLARGFVFENGSDRSVFVVPDGDTAEHDAVETHLGAFRDPVRVAYEGELTGDDLRKNLYVQGALDALDLSWLDDPTNPIHVDSASVVIGPYRFPRDETGLLACFPNPHNRERYVILHVHGARAVRPPFEGWTDFVVYGSVASTDAREELLSGFFEKTEGNRWSFCDRLTHGSPAARTFCQGGVCPAPVMSDTSPSASRTSVSVRAVPDDSHGERYVLGDGPGRFPALTVDPSGHAWVAWEERGDVLLAAVADERPEVIFVEGDESDSFNPVLAHDGRRLWIVYLNDRDGVYRVRARTMDDGRLSEEILISEPGPLDAITPAVIADAKGDVTLVWSEWKANQRFLRRRTVSDLVPGPVRDVLTQPADITYTNAWMVRLTVTSDGQVWGAWNQHYPATLGVCAGDLVERVSSVTRLVGNIEENQNGGYPAIAVDAEDVLWVAWESLGWDVLRDRSQTIQIARRDPLSVDWSLPETVSGDTYYNQTPVVAGDGAGGLWIAWSGRVDATGPWGVYVASRSADGWTEPRRVSGEDEVARAPALAVIDGQPWVAWHSGVGDDMRVVVLVPRARSGPAPT